MDSTKFHFKSKFKKNDVRNPRSQINKRNENNYTSKYNNNRSCKYFAKLFLGGIVPEYVVGNQNKSEGLI